MSNQLETDKGQVYIYTGNASDEKPVCGCGGSCGCKSEGSDSCSCGNDCSCK